MRFKIITMFVIYIIGIIISQQLMYGWYIADFHGDFPTLRSERRCYANAGKAAIFSMFSIAWPITLPETYWLTGYAYHGWMDLEDCLDDIK